MPYHKKLIRMLLLPALLVLLSTGFAVISIYRNGSFAARTSLVSTGTSVSTGASQAGAEKSNTVSIPKSLIPEGHILFIENCSSCHTNTGEGSYRGPNLVGLGAATVDFWVSTGRMPLSQPGIEAVQKPSRLTRQQTLAIVAYVTSLGKGGPPIPKVNLKHANVSEGQTLFALNCASCHTITGSGDALSNRSFSSSLHIASPTQIAEALRIGPGNMPRFGPRTLNHKEVEDIAAYVTRFIQHPNNAGGVGLGGVGPVAEGFIALLIGLGGLMLVSFWIGDRQEKEESRDGH
ncbi:MAG: c-type cytochrome [Actinobacteria bacterium]|nr:c-type cytochrome [Actinomycetota bacterium]MCL6104911.1 c-type cytochrome [Actinomycetota bacterium]